MTFCSQCGHRLIRRHVGGDSRERDVCGACHTVHYENPKILVWCFAYWRDQIVLCRRAHEPARGLWNPPTGFVEMGETLEEAAARETFEEAGLELTPASLLLYKVVSLPHMNQVYVGFRVELQAEPELTPGPEVLEVRLWSEAEFPVQEFVFRQMIKDAPESFFRCLRTGKFPVVCATVRVD
jgi:ADP-ribose pyrophosphatase YjhB (NUDIX family)